MSRRGETIEWILPQPHPPDPANSEHHGGHGHSATDDMLRVGPAGAEGVESSAVGL